MRRLLLVVGIVGILVLLFVLAADPVAEWRPEPGDPGGRRDPVGPRVDIPEDEAGDATGEIAGAVRRGKLPVAARLELLALDREETLLTSASGRSPPLRTARAGNTGSFLFDRLPPGRFQVRATTSDGSTGSTVVLLRYAGERTRAVVAIPAGPHLLRGRAVYEDGRPFLGLVSAVESISSGRLIRDAGVTTDEDGAFTIRGLPPGLVRISCLLPYEYRLVGPCIRIPFDKEYLLVVDRDATELTGRVLDEADGSPIPDALVRVCGDTARDRWCVVRTRTDTKGRFRVRVLPIRRDLEVRAKGYSAARRDVANNVANLTIRLGRTAVLTGRVLSGTDRRPRPGLTVFCEPLNNWSDGEWRAVTGRGGRFTLSDVPNGPVRIFASGNGWISSGRRVREFEPGSTPSLTLLVIPAVRVEGRVVDRAGVGLSGATVQAEGWLETGVNLPEPPGTATGPDGSFAFDNLVPGKSYQVRASSPGLPPVKSPPITGESGETIEVTLEIAAGAESARWLEVRVIDRETGEPVPAAIVLVGGRSGRTGEDGLARMGPFGPRPVSVWARHPDYLISKDHPVLEAGAGLAEMTFPLQRGLAVAGRVALPDGSPLENGTVWVTAAVDESGAPADSVGGQVTAGGEFRVGGLLAGRCRVKIGGTGPGGGGYWAEVVTEAGTEDLVLTTERHVGLDSGQSLVFRVTDRDGEPVPAGTVEVRFTGEEGTWSNDFPIEDGWAEMEFWGLVGRITVVVHGARSLSGRRLSLGSARLGPLPLCDGEMEIRLPEERTISGFVRDERDRVVAGVRVFALPADAAELEFEIPHAVAYSDDRGAFRLRGLGEGEYLIHADPPPAFLQALPVSARGGMRDLAIALARGATARIRVVGPDGSPLAGAHVRAADPTYEDDRAFHGYSRRDGVVKLEGLMPGWPYKIVVTPPADPRPLMPVTRVGFKPADTEIMLPAGMMVGGVVLFPDGSPAPGITVDACPQGGGHDWGKTARDGSFRFGPYPAGPVRLSTRTTGPSSRPVEVPAGREDVRLTRPAGVRLSVRILNWSETYGPARARLSSSGGTRWAVVQKDGTVTFVGLPEGGSHSLWVGPVGDGLFLSLKDLSATEKATEASLVRGGSITGRVVLPPGARDPGLRVTVGGFTLTGLVDDQGSFRISGMPEGSCVVTAWATLDRRRIEGHLWARTGDSVTLELGPR